MTRLPNDCFATGDGATRLDQALAALDRRLKPLVEAESVPLAGCLGRVLAAPVVSAVAVPAHDNSAVDGYACRFDDLARGQPTPMSVAGRAAAGHPFAGAWAPGQAVRILTGAALPPELDTVVMQEDCRRDGDAVILPPGLGRGANCRRAGEDIAAGSTILPAGRRLRAQEIGLAAAAGHATLRVYRPLGVALLSTGDELREPGLPLPAGCIHDSNRHMVAGLVAGLGCRVTDLGIAPDRVEAISERLAAGARDHQVVISSGGVSVGDEDHVKTALGRLGSLHFWRLAIKPGRPVAVGQIGAAVFFGLPGNPVSALITFLMFVRPLLQRLAGATPTRPPVLAVRAGFGYDKRTARREWLPVTLAAAADDGIPVARKFPRQGSGVLSSVVDSDGLIELAEDVSAVEFGSLVRFIPLRGWDD